MSGILKPGLSTMTDLTEGLKELAESEYGQVVVGLVAVGAALLIADRALVHYDPINDLLNRFTGSSGVERFDDLADMGELALTIFGPMLPVSLKDPLKKVIDLVQAGTKAIDLFIEAWGKR